MKNKAGNAIRDVAAIQSEIKEEIAAKHRQINDLYKDVSKLKASLEGYRQRRFALETEHSNKVNAFIRENEPSTTSNLAEATTVNIVYELRRRGFDGIISRYVDNDIEQYDLSKFNDDTDPKLTDDNERFLRMCYEHKELCGRLTRLVAFLDTDKFNSLPEHHQALLKRQCRAMDDYDSALMERIKLESTNQS